MTTARRYRRWPHVAGVSVGVALLANSLAACSSPCTLEGQIDDYIADSTLKDCGNLVEPVDSASWRAAHDCVMAANAAHEPFICRFEQNTIEGADRYAYTGLFEGQTWQLSLFVRQQSPTGMAHSVERLRCTYLRDEGSACTGDICVKCDGPFYVSGCTID